MCILLSVRVHAEESQRPVKRGGTITPTGPDGKYRDLIRMLLIGIERAYLYPQDLCAPDLAFFQLKKCCVCIRKLILVDIRPDRDLCSQL